MTSTTARPMFSVVMPAFNSEPYIRSAIESVLNQHYEHWELLIVDDGSTDSTAAIADEYASLDSRLTVIRQENAGAGDARNHALAAATGRWVVFLDSDDAMLSDCLEEYDQFIAANPGYDFYTCNGYRVAPSGSRTRVLRGERARRLDSVTFEQLLLEGPLFFGSSVFSPDALAKVGSFRSHIYNEDYDLMLRLLVSGHRHKFCPLPLTLYNARPDSKTRQQAVAAASTFEIVESLDAQSLRVNDLTRTWICARRKWKSRASIAAMQAQVIRGDRSEAMRILSDPRSEIIRSLPNLLRRAAVVVIFPLYRHWLRR